MSTSPSLRAARTRMIAGAALLVGLGATSSVSPAYAGPAPTVRRAARPVDAALPAAPPAGPEAAAPRGAGGAAAGRAGAAELTGDEAAILPYNECKRIKANARFRITLPPEVELQDLLQWMSKVSCQKFIWDTKVRSGKVTILSPEEVTLAEAYAAFYAALETMGLTVEPSGEYFKIVETVDAKSRTLPVYGPDGNAPNNDRFVTQLFRVQGAAPKDVVDLLNRLKTKQGSVEAVGDLIILTDTGSSVRRLRRIVAEIDDPQTSGEKIFFFQLRYADPEEVASIVRDIFGEKPASQANVAPGTAGPSFSRVIVDERTGTLIVVTQEADYQVIKRLVKQLDVPMAMGGGRIHVIKLRNADAEEVAQTLSQLASGAQSANRGGASGGGRGGGPPAPTPTPTASSADLFSGEVKVTPDKATRSLVILASTNDMRALMPVIEQLDAERRQVYIETYILELAVGKVLSGGAGAHFGSTFGTPAGEGLGFVASAPNQQANSLFIQPGALEGIVGGVLGPQIPGSGQFFGLGQDIPAFGVIIQALQTSGDVNIVSTPHIHTADNQPGELEVGSSVPTPGAIQAVGGLPGGVGVPIQQIQRENVTLKVKITPRINDDQNVTLDVEVDKRDIERIDPTLGVTTSDRRLKLEKIVARDDQPIVLGGLVQEVERDTVQQVPGLGSIPVLGWLFKRKRRERQKVNLLIVLVPHIVDSPDDVRRIHKQRLEERQEFLDQTAFKKRDLRTNVNYRSKTGLLSTIDREARRMEQQEYDLRDAETEMMRDDITGEIGLSPRKGEAESAGVVGPSGPPSGPTPAAPPARPRAVPPPVPAKEG